MEKKQVAAESPTVVAGITLVPVVKTSVWCQQNDGIISVFGFKWPTDLVLVTSTAKRAFRITGEEVPLDQLIEEFPILEETLEEIEKGGHS